MGKMMLESFRRLYQAKRITEEDLRTRVLDGRLTEEEYATITGRTYTAGSEQA